MKIAIRLDDITEDMDWDRFSRFCHLLDSHEIRPLLGVVPDPHDPSLRKGPRRDDFWDILNRLHKEKGYLLSMHGCHHVYTTNQGGMFPLNKESEFAGVPYEVQRDLIRDGKEILHSHGIDVNLFMAPAHSYDLNTLRALYSCGFVGLTDGFGTRPYRYENLIFYPISYSRKRSLQKKNGITTFVVHCNTLTEQDFEEYDTILSSQDVVSYDEMFSYDVSGRSALGRGKEYVMASVKRALVQHGKKGTRK